MGLSLGIVGLPNVGKSTLFNALTNKSVLSANYPFATIDPSLGVVAVPDERLDKLTEMSESDKKIPAAVEFVDIAGLVKGASVGEGLGNAFLANIREVDAIAEVVRLFEDENVIHVNDAIDPLEDIEIINLELILADQQTVAKRRGNIERDIKRGNKEAKAEAEVLAAFESSLENGRLLSEEDLSKEAQKQAHLLNLLTIKPFLYVLNKKAGAVNIDEVGDERWQNLLRFFEETGSEYVIVDAGAEEELRGLSMEERSAFREDLEVQEDGVDKLITAGFRALDLIQFFTTGEKETRGWTIRRGSRAPEAGAAIHTDFKDKFIRADVISFEDLIRVGSFAQAREEGLLRTEGKDYIVQDGDVIEFKI